MLNCKVFRGSVLGVVSVLSYVFGAWLSLVERFLGVEEVASSNLVAPTN